MVAKVKKDECIACGSCVDVCPVEAITLDDIAVIDEEKCTDCGACVEECPTDAIELEN
jgi:ferredoxin